jgi:predicted ATPase
LAAFAQAVRFEGVLCKHALAQRRPTLFIEDDLHWADRSSLDLFGHLVFTVADTAARESVPLFIVGTYRPTEPETHLARLIARLQRELICRTLTLRGLNESEIHALVQGLGLPRSSHQLITTVSGATQGNPLFIQEVLHHLVQQEALQDRGGYLVATAAAADLQLPEQVTGAIVWRVRQLNRECQRVLAFAALLGDACSMQVLSAVTDLSEDRLLDLLEEAMRQRILQSEGKGLRFAHPLIRHVFYHETSQARRQRMHRHIAETLERLHAGAPNEHVLEMVHHLTRAGPLSEAHKVVNYARKAGDQAFNVFAWGDSALYYEGALAAAETREVLSLQDQAELHYLAGLACYRDEDVGPCWTTMKRPSMPTEGSAMCLGWPAC